MHCEGPKCYVNVTLESYLNYLGILFILVLEGEEYVISSIVVGQRSEVNLFLSKTSWADHKLPIHSDGFRTNLKVPPPLLPPSSLSLPFHSSSLPSSCRRRAGLSPEASRMEAPPPPHPFASGCRGLVGPTTTSPHLSLSLSLAVGPHPNGPKPSNRLAVAGYMSPPPPAPPRETCSPPASATFAHRFGISSNTSRPSPPAGRGAVRRDPIRRLLPRAVTTSTTTRTTPPQQQHV